MNQSESLTKWADKISAAGGEVLGPTNPYKSLRFRTLYGTGVVYTNKRGKVTWNTEAIMARDHLRTNKGSLAPVEVHGRRKASRAVVNAIMARDGVDCFFCGKPLNGDITIEHLVAVCHGGPNHVSNMFLAHSVCNQTVGHMSAPEKVAYAIRERAA